MSSHRPFHPMLWGIGRRLLLVAAVVIPLWLAVWLIVGADAG